MVRGAPVAEVAELQRHRRRRLLAQQVVDPQALADREEVVLVQPDWMSSGAISSYRQPEHAVVVGVDLLEDGADVRTVGLLLAQPLAPRRDVRAGSAPSGATKPAASASA